MRTYLENGKPIFGLILFERNVDACWLVLGGGTNCLFCHHVSVSARILFLPPVACDLALRGVGCVVVEGREFIGYGTQF